MYYNIKVINNLNIDFIVVVVNITQYPTCNDAGVLVFNSDPDSHFFPGFPDQAQKWFWNSLKIESPQQENLGKLLCNTVVYHVYIIDCNF